MVIVLYIGSILIEHNIYILSYFKAMVVLIVLSVKSSLWNKSDLNSKHLNIMFIAICYCLKQMFFLIFKFRD
jgi:hypothetical protein